jgi:formylglycine-generating enzyme
VERRGAGNHQCSRSIPLRWVPVLGGTCRFGDRAHPQVVGDLLVTVSPLTYQQLDRAGEAADADLPVTGIDYAEAGRLAELIGGRLPTSVEWEWLAAGPQRRPFPWGAQPWAPHLARLRGRAVEYEGPGPVGGCVAGATVRREALCCIPNSVGRNLEDCFWVQWLT